MSTREICKAVDAGTYAGPITPEILGAVRWYSVSQGVRRVCDRHMTLAAEARERAAKTRYHRLASAVLGAAGEMIYDGAYGEAPEIGNWTYDQNGKAN